MRSIEMTEAEMRKCAALVGALVCTAIDMGHVDGVAKDAVQGVRMDPESHRCLVRLKSGVVVDISVRNFFQELLTRTPSDSIGKS